MIVRRKRKNWTQLLKTLIFILICMVVSITLPPFSALASTWWQIDANGKNLQPIAQLQNFSSNIKISPDGKYFYTATKDNELKIYSITGELLKTYPNSPKCVRSFEGWINEKINLTTYELRPKQAPLIRHQTLDPLTGTYQIYYTDDSKSSKSLLKTFSPNFKYFYSININASLALTVYDLTTGTQSYIASTSQSFPIWSPNSTMIAFQDAKSQLIITNPQGKVLHWFEQYLSHQPLAWSPDGNYLLTTAISEQRLCIIETSTWKIIRQYKVNYVPKAVWSSDSKNFVYIDTNSAHNIDDNISIWKGGLHSSKKRLLSNASDIFPELYWAADGQTIYLTRTETQALPWFKQYDYILNQLPLWFIVIALFILFYFINRKHLKRTAPKS